MANVWLVKKGAEPTRGGPWRSMDVQKCVEKLDLKQSNFHSDLSKGPRFGNTDKPPAVFAGPVAVVVQIQESEAAQYQWKPGFYVLDITPREAERRCGADS